MDSTVLNKRKQELLDNLETTLKNKIDLGNKMSDSDKAQHDAGMKELDAINNDLEQIKILNANRAQIGAPREDVAIPGMAEGKSKFQAYAGKYAAKALPFVTDDMVAKFYKSLQSPAAFQNFIFSNAALGEGGTAADGSAIVPVQTDPAIPFLKPIECVARSLSRVLPTTKNTYFPFQSAKSTAAVKAETNNSGTNNFTTSVPQFETTLLAAYTVGNSIPVSIELLEDVPLMNAWLPGELQRAVRVEEEYLFISGSGTNQPQGYLGNGATAFGPTISSGASSLASHGVNPILETVAALNADYYSNAKWLVNRQEFVRLLEAQLAQNQFQTYVTWEKATAFLHGYEVAFSGEMPVYAASPAVDGAWMFGDFDQFAYIGDRYGSSLRVKVDPYTGMAAGQTVIYGYRRTDQRIILAEACVQLNTNG